MRIIEVKAYQFDELNEKAKERARDWYRNATAGDNDAWDQVREDAEQIGLRIISLEDNRPNVGEFIGSAHDTVKLILENHGIHCETFQTATKYGSELNRLYKLASDSDTIESEQAYENCIHEFLHDLLEDYRVMLNREIEYMYSAEYVDENIRANEYEFNAEGKRV